MSDCGYVYIENWEKFQHPDAVRSNNMPWLKMYTDLLGNDDWLELTPADRTLLQGLWMLTGRYGLGRVRADSGWLNAQLKIRKGSLERLKDAGFISILASKGARITASTSASAELEGSKEPLDKEGEARADGAAMNGAVTRSSRKEVKRALEVARSVTEGDTPSVAAHTIRDLYPELADSLIATISKERKAVPHD